MVLAAGSITLWPQLARQVGVEPAILIAVILRQLNDKSLSHAFEGRRWICTTDDWHAQLDLFWPHDKTDDLVRQLSSPNPEVWDVPIIIMGSHPLKEVFRESEKMWMTLNDDYLSSMGVPTGEISGFDDTVSDDDTQIGFNTGF